MSSRLKQNFHEIILNLLLFSGIVCPVLSHPISPTPTPYHPISSHPTPSHPFPSRPILFRPILSYFTEKMPLGPVQVYASPVGHHLQFANSAPEQ